MRCRGFGRVLGPVIFIILGFATMPAIARADEPPSPSNEPSGASPPQSNPATSSQSAGATPTKESDARDGLRFGLRSGYMIGVGKTFTTINLNELISGGVPIWVDIGYRFAGSHVYVGGFFAYAALFADGDECGRSGVECSASQIRFGAMAAYHLIPEGPFDPWIGLGFGYEMLSFSQSGGRLLSAGPAGLELAHLQLGGDIVATPNIKVGPWLGGSVGQYSNPPSGSTSGDVGSTDSASIHGWLTIGVRGAYDLHL